MNAYCTYDDDSTYYDFAESGGAGYDSGYDSTMEYGLPETGRSTLGEDLLDEKLEYAEARDLQHDFEHDPDAWHFEECDAVERHAMRKATVETTLEVIADHAAGPAGPDVPAAVALLTWSSAILTPSTRHALSSVIHEGGQHADLSQATTDLALWRAGDLEREDLQRVARKNLDAARVVLSFENRDDHRVIEGPWRRGTPPLDRTHQLHLLLLAVRHASLELDEADLQVAELWQEELRTELSARQREIRSGADASKDGDHFEDSVHLVAAISEMWRDIAPAARPVRLPLEKLTRLLWQSARSRRVLRAERAALLIAAGNQRLDDLPAKLLEAGLYALDPQGCLDPDDDSDGCDSAVRRLSATWIGGKRPSFAPQVTALNLATEALVMRALSGPARTGPRRG